MNNTGYNKLLLRFDVEQADGRVGTEGRENYLMWVLPRVSIVAGGIAATTKKVSYICSPSDTFAA